MKNRIILGALLALTIVVLFGKSGKVHAQEPAQITAEITSSISLHVTKQKYISIQRIEPISAYSYNREFVSSDPQIAIVDNEGLVTAVKPGETTIQLWIDGQNAAECSVVVKKIPVPKLYTQIRPSGEITKWARIRYNSITVHINTDFVGASMLDPFEGSIQVYRSTKKNSGYKRIKTFSWWILKDKRVKPNRTYYYKARFKPEGSKFYSSFSKPVAYYTSPKPIKYTSKKGNVYKWKKVKGVKRYYIKWGYQSREYTIFGTIATSWCDCPEVVKRRKFKCPSYGHATMTKKIRPIAKHGKYYYLQGAPPLRTLLDVENYDFDGIDEEYQ